MIESWNLHRIDIAPGEPAKVQLRQGKTIICFNTSDFAVGRKNSKTAALAKFVASSGYGDAAALFRFFVVLGSDWRWPLPVDGMDISETE
jgi:hypothetical protein